jgi:hypothetical protein
LKEKLARRVVGYVLPPEAGRRHQAKQGRTCPHTLLTVKILAACSRIPPPSAKAQKRFDFFVFIGVYRRPFRVPFPFSA